MNDDKTKETIFPEVILKFEDIYREYGLTYSEIVALLEEATHKVHNPFNICKFI